MHKTLMIAAITVAMVAPAVAMASDDRGQGDDSYRDDDRHYGSDRGPAVLHQSWLPLSEVARSIEAAGYRILEIDLDDGVWEVDAISPDGRQVEAYVDPATGEVLRGWRRD